MTADHIPDLVLERYRLNELPPTEAARIAERLGVDVQLRQRLEMLDQSDEALREPIERMRARLGAYHVPARQRSIAWPIPAAVAISALLAVVVWQTIAPGSSVPAETTATDRVKGGGSSGLPALALYRRTAEGSEQLGDGAVAHAGDLIRVGYRAAGRHYGVIVSIDGAGVVTMHLPPSGNRSAALKDEAIVLLDQAYELDAAPRWERFYFVAGASSFDAGPIVQAARDAAKSHPQGPVPALALPSGLDQAGFTLQKESTR
jgi:hypothetical protein